MVMECRVVERMCARPVCCCILLHHVYCILILILILGTIPISYTVDPAPFWPSSRRKTLKIFVCGAFASGGAYGGPSDTPFSPPSGGFVTDLRTTPGKTAGCWGRGWTRGRVRRRCGDCDCGARGLKGLGVGGWIWGIRLQAPRGPALRVRDSVAAAATWLDIARYSDTGGLSQRYTPGGGYTTTTVAPI